MPDLSNIDYYYTITYERDFGRSLKIRFDQETRKQIDKIIKQVLHKIDVNEVHSIELRSNRNEFVNISFIKQFQELYKLGLDCDFSLKELDKLDLNKLQQLRITRDNIEQFNSSKLPNLRHLSLVSRYNLNITYNLIGLDKLSHLYIISNNATDIRDDILRLPNLELLYLKSSLTTLPEDFFKNTPNLKRLELSSNKFETLPGDLFQHLPSLVHLNLSKNKLQQLELEIFKNLTNLKKLNLLNNDIKRLLNGIFDDLLNLDDLRLGRNDNSPTLIDAEALRNCRNLQTMFLREVTIIGRINRFIENQPDLQTMQIFLSETQYKEFKRVLRIVNPELLTTHRSVQPSMFSRAY